MNDYTIPLILLIIVAIAGVVGLGIYSDKLKAQAIEHGAAYYHPKTGDFVWKECKNEKRR